MPVSENKNIKTYTAADIEKYWKRQLSKAAMHEMEKAALDDPFLADAMEGYKNNVNTTDDVRQVNQKLEERVSGKTKVIPFGNSNIKWLRVAAAIIIIGGIGILTQQLFFNSQKNELALTKESKTTASKTAPQSSPGINDTAETISTPAETKKGDVSTIEKDKSPGILNSPVTVEKITAKDIITSHENITKAEDAKEKSVVADQPVSNQALLAESVVASPSRSKTDSNKSADGLASGEFYAAGKKQANAAPNYAAGAVNLNHRFLYRVMDAQNNPVPFANVSNTSDGVGTYTDMKGYFNLVSVDSILDVQVKSLGYATSVFTLNPSKTISDLVIQEDEKLRSEILANNRKVISSTVKRDTAELEEPEIGWGYYNTYAVNNLKIPDEIREKKPAANVEISFEVDTNGHPANIKVTKSSQCRSCDEEVIRLLKEGPKWKRKGKKSKTRVTIALE